MDNSDFILLAEETLQTIYDAIEAADQEFTLEVDLLGGVLNIELPDGGEYVINKHAPTTQIWLSSPTSGASHFSYDEDDERWTDTSGNDLHEMLQSELERYDINLEF